MKVAALPTVAAIVRSLEDGPQRLAKAGIAAVEMAELLEHENLLVGELAAAITLGNLLRLGHLEPAIRAEALRLILDVVREVAAMPVQP